MVISDVKCASMEKCRVWESVRETREPRECNQRPDEGVGRTDQKAGVGNLDSQQRSRVGRLGGLFRSIMEDDWGWERDERGVASMTIASNPASILSPGRWNGVRWRRQPAE